MRAFAIDEYKGPLREVEAAEPDVGPRDVLVRVEAAGLNPVDEMIRVGSFKQMLGHQLPLILGSDLAGTVVQVGADVTGFRVGDEVYTSPRPGRIGSFAERISVHEDDLARKPMSIDITQAGAVPLVALTAWQALVERGNVQPGQQVLIHAGAGGVGSMAIQLAKHLGATVATTASARDAAFVTELGADVVIDYRTQDFEQIISGYDLVLDSLGGENLTKSMRVLRRGGTVIGIAGPPDPTFARRMGFNAVMRLVITGLSASTRRRARKLGVTYEFLFKRADGDQLRTIAKLIDDGALRPIIGQVVGFDDTASALESMGASQTPGKTVVVGAS